MVKFSVQFVTHWLTSLSEDKCTRLKSGISGIISLSRLGIPIEALVFFSFAYVDAGKTTLIGHGLLLQNV